MVGVLNMHNNFLSLQGFGNDVIFYSEECEFGIFKTTSNVLAYRISQSGYINILKNIKIYKKHKGNLYVISNDGYAVVNINENTCKVFYDSNNISENINKFSNNIKLLKSFEDFSAVEKEYFLKLTKLNE